jgi:hypothetical protein
MFFSTPMKYNMIVVVIMPVRCIYVNTILSNQKCIMHCQLLFLLMYAGICDILLYLYEVIKVTFSCSIFWSSESEQDLICWTRSDFIFYLVIFKHVVWYWSYPSIHKIAELHINIFYELWMHFAKLIPASYVSFSSQSVHDFLWKYKICSLFI